jgi:hypothetical protein
LPPALLITEEDDPAWDEGQDYADRVRVANVATTVTQYPPMIHGFFLMAGALDAGKKCIDDVAAALTEAFRSTLISPSMLPGPHSSEKRGHGSDGLSGLTQLSANNSLGSPHLCAPCRQQASASKTASAFAWFSSKPVDDRRIPTVCLGPSLWMTEHDRCNDVVVLRDFELGFDGW